MPIVESRRSHRSMSADTGAGGRSLPPGKDRSSISAWGRLLARRESLLPLPLYLVLIVVIVIPLGYLVFAAFQTGSPTDPSSTFTLKNITAIWTNPIYLRVLGNTMLLAFLVTIFSCVIGVTMAWAVARTNLPGMRMFEFLLPIPLFLSPFAGALAWQFLGSKNAGFLNAAFKGLFHVDAGFMNILTLPGLVFVMVLFHVPYAYLYTLAPLKNMNGALEEASRVGGASVARTMIRVTLPVILPGVLSAAIMVFVLSAEMFTVPALLGSGAGFSTLSTFIYTQTQFSPPNWGAASTAGLLLIVIMLVGIVLQNRATRMSSRFVTITGKGVPPVKVILRGWRWVLAVLPAVYLILAIFLPLAMLVLASFLTFVTPQFTAQSFTVDNWRTLGMNPVFLTGLKNTIVVALVGSVLVAIFAFLLVYAWKRLKSPLRRTTESIAMFPVAVPGIVLGVGALWAFARTPLYGTIWILILAYAGRYLANPVRVFSSTMVQVDPGLEEASRVGGAGMFRTLTRVSAPLLAPATLSAWLLLFVTFTRELNIAIMIYSASSIVLPVIMWGAIASGSTAYASCIAIIESAVIFAAYFVARFVFKVDLSSARL